MDCSCLIFSRDRPMQLHALLESLVEYAPELFSSIVVLYKPTSPMQALGYLECGHAFDDWSPKGGVGIEFWRQSTSFEDDVREWLGGAGEQVCFLVDDDLFIRPVPEVELPDGEICFSLRLETWEESAEVRHSWIWPNQDADYGYPFALDGHIFRRETIAYVLRGLRFDDPTRLEAGMAGLAAEIAIPERMASFNRRRLIGIPANRVSPSSGMPFDNRGRAEWSPEALTIRYLDGWRIDRAAMQAELLQATDAHWPATLCFAR